MYVFKKFSVLLIFIGKECAIIFVFSSAETECWQEQRCVMFSIIQYKSGKMAYWHPAPSCLFLQAALYANHNMASVTY